MTSTRTARFGFRLPALLVFALIGVTTTWSVPARATITVPTQPYLMAFGTCAPGATDCMNPGNHLVQLAQSPDGRSWSLLGGWQSFKGSVPDVFRRGNTLYLYSTSGLMRIDMTTGATTTTAVTLNEGGYVDPSIAQTPDGRLILFYLPGIMGQDPAQCAQGESSCVRQIKSAVEVAGSDGAQFVVDAGARISETITSGSFSDPDIFYNGSEWVVYVSRGSSVHAYTSTSLQGSYTFRGVVSNNIGGVPSAIPLADGSIATYVHTQVGASREIRIASTATGISSITAFQTVVSGPALGLGLHAESPGVALNAVGVSCAACTTATTTTSTSTTSTTTTARAATGPRIGATCTRAGAAATSAGVKLVCKKSGKRLVWSKR
jgi:hypothetical protein